MAKISSSLLNKRGYENRKKMKLRRTAAMEEVRLAAAKEAGGDADVKLNLATLLESVDQNKLRALLDSM